MRPAVGKPSLVENFLYADRAAGADRPAAAPVVGLPDRRDAFSGELPNFRIPESVAGTDEHGTRRSSCLRVNVIRRISDLAGLRKPRFHEIRIPASRRPTPVDRAGEPGFLRFRNGPDLVQNRVETNQARIFVADALDQARADIVDLQPITQCLEDMPDIGKILVPVV